MTTPAMNLPCPSVTPEAVRISVSIRSLVTEARAGMTAASSLSEAWRHAALVGRLGLAAENSRRTRSARIHDGLAFTFTTESKPHFRPLYPPGSVASNNNKGGSEASYRPAQLDVSSMR